jgi:hypothetical protein
MINFGILKSKIENRLTESYGKDTLKKDLAQFKKLVLENKNISKLYYLYDDLSSNKGLNESIVDDYINSCITIYENSINKITTKNITEIQKWVGSIQCENEYKNIDSLFSNNLTKLEEKIQSKKIIKESLLEKNNEVVLENLITNVSMKSLVNIANKTIKNHISNLNESEQNELKVLLSTPKETLIENYSKIKDEVVSKLKTTKSTETDNETLGKIDEVIKKVTTESFNEVNYYKIKKLNENL